MSERVAIASTLMLASNDLVVRGTLAKPVRLGKPQHNEDGQREAGRGEEGGEWELRTAPLQLQPQTVEKLAWCLCGNRPCRALHTVSER